VSIPFRAARGDDERAAAFLRVIRDEAGGYDGALFVINARGEPLEFVSSRLEAPRTRLWRPEDLRRRAARELAAALFNAITARPAVVFARADEVEADLFVSDIETPVATCRVAAQAVPAGAADGGGEDVAAVSAAVEDRTEDTEADGPRLLWSSGPPPEGSPERILAERLRSVGLLTEPFERAEAGLREARGDDVSGRGAGR
jgi:hypothetical protein